MRTGFLLPTDRIRHHRARSYRGYIMKIDKVNNPDDLSFVSSVMATDNKSNITWLYHYPKAGDIVASQQDYIREYIDTVETVIQSGYFDDPATGYQNIWIYHPLSIILSLPSFPIMWMVSKPVHTFIKINRLMMAQKVNSRPVRFGIITLR